MVGEPTYTNDIANAYREAEFEKHEWKEQELLLFTETCDEKIPYQGRYFIICEEFDSEGENETLMAIKEKTQSEFLYVNTGIAAALRLWYQFAVQVHKMPLRKDDPKALPFAALIGMRYKGIEVSFNLGLSYKTIACYRPWILFEDGEDISAIGIHFPGFHFQVRMEFQHDTFVGYKVYTKTYIIADMPGLGEKCPLQEGTFDIKLVKEWAPRTLTQLCVDKIRQGSDARYKTKEQILTRALGVAF